LGIHALFSNLKWRFSTRADWAILMYHRVTNPEDSGNEFIQPGMKVDRNIFDEQMSFLKNSYSIISLNSLINTLRNDQIPHKKTIVITFDDGWRDNYLYAYPVLCKYGIPATIFLTTDFIGTDNIFWFAKMGFLYEEFRLHKDKFSSFIGKIKESFGDLLYPDLEKWNAAEALPDRDRFIEFLKQLDTNIIQRIVDEFLRERAASIDSHSGKCLMLNWDEVLQMSLNNIEFGSHGSTHRIMTRLDLSEARKELAESKKTIEKRINCRISAFAYPNGDYSSNIEKLTEEAGYDCGLATHGHDDEGTGIHLFSLRRINVHDGMSIGPGGNFSKALFALEISGLIDLLWQGRRGMHGDY